jgi:hypothetical protein
MKNKAFILILISAFAILCFSAANAQTKPGAGGNDSGAVNPSDSVKCSGITSKGLQCRSKWVEANGYCRVHNPDKLICGQTKANGEPCKNVVNTKGELCHVHKVKKG